MAAKSRSAARRRPIVHHQAPVTIPPTPPQPDLPIVGIGASAGGLEAFTQLLQALPTDTGMAFVLIQHLEPLHDSLLSEILARTTAMTVHEVQHGMTIVPNCVYVIPPNTRMTLVHGQLELAPRSRTSGKHLPIDAFFQSLATEQGPQSIAIVLSGSGNDGTIGITAIKASGGITFAQSPDSAEFPVMPENAIATGQVDFVLTPAAIAAELVQISRQPDLARSVPISPASLDPEPHVNDPAALNQVFALLRNAMGVDFTHYKQGTLRRRIMRRMALCQIASIDDYVQYLQTHPIEVAALYHDILINVTSFFREPASFEALKTQVLPRLLPLPGDDRPLRIWIPGCATGEEAYSIAITLLEFLADRVIKPTIQIFATDISEVAIGEARLGIYPPNRLTTVSAERLSRFFVPTAGGFQISKAVRELCIFACQDLTRDPPFSRLDLISCRNVLIYFTPLLQKKVMPIFHYALQPDGYLMLGSAESVGEFSDRFAITDKKMRIYHRKAAPAPPNFRFMTHQTAITQSSAIVPVVTAAWTDLDLTQAADQIVLDRYAPAGVIINADWEILQFRGQTSAYFEPAPGKASLNLLKMARPEWALALRSAVDRATQQGMAIRQPGLPFADPDTTLPRATVTVEVIPFGPPTGRDRYFLILFEPAPSALPPARPTDPQSTASPQALRQECDRLTRELAGAKAYLTSIIAAHEASNQDLKVANEEILSSNEELQSTNEELETAKEEIQATNEELSTINEELRSRNHQLNQVNSDLHNLLSSVNIPILMLSGDLRIRRFTPMAESLFNLIATDVGRPFSDMQHNLQLPNLGALTIDVINTLNTHEQEVQDTSGHWYSLRIRPYKTIDNHIDGAVINLIDIDVLKRHAALIEQSRDYATAIGDEKAILLRELRHRVKNNLQVISSLLSLQSSRTTDATAIQILQDSQNRVQTIALMHEVLHRSPNLAALNFAEYVKLLVSYVFSSGNLQPEAIAPAVDVPADLPIHPDQAVLCGLIINELVTNALKYGAPPAPDASSPSVSVQITLTDRQLSLAVSNDGDTLPTDFDLAALPTIGLKLVTNLVEQLNGTLQIDRGQQTTFKICFNLEEQRLK